MYQDFVDRFAMEMRANDGIAGDMSGIGRPVQSYGNGTGTHAMDVGYFYGGDPAGIWDKLDYIKKLSGGHLSESGICILQP